VRHLGFDNVVAPEATKQPHEGLAMASIEEAGRPQYRSRLASCRWTLSSPAARVLRGALPPAASRLSRSRSTSRSTVLRQRPLPSPRLAVLCRPWRYRRALAAEPGAVRQASRVFSRPARLELALSGAGGGGGWLSSRRRRCSCREGERRMVGTTMSAARARSSKRSTRCFTLEPRRSTGRGARRAPLLPAGERLVATGSQSRPVILEGVAHHGACSGTGPIVSTDGIVRGS
jgi:hypothetical protein